MADFMKENSKASDNTEALGGESEARAAAL